MTQADEPVTTQSGGRRSGILSVLLRLALPLLILGVGWIGYSMLSVEPEEPIRPKAKPKLIKTRVLELRIQDYPTIIRTRGVVRPHNEVPLTSQVSGKIIRLLPGFEDGAFFQKDEVLLELDPLDFETSVTIAEAAVARASTILEQEKARSKQAKLNWEELEYDEEPNELVLRVPQMREAEANLNSARAQRDRATRDLDRSKVRAPFDGRVRQRAVGLGQSVGVGTPLGTVFSIDFAEIRLPIPARDRAFLSLPEDAEDAPVDVELRDALGDNTETVWRGTIIRTEGALDPNSLDLFAIAHVVDPFGRKSGKPPLRIGQPVVAGIPGRILKDVFVVPRRAVSQIDRIFLIDPKELTVESLIVEPIWTDDDHLVVNDPAIVDGILLAMTNLIYAPSGSKVEILPDLESEETSESETTASESNASASGKKEPQKEDSSS